ncbi:apoptosis antagonizing transcription factor-domain-containing protein [Spinellus fusiger]|nr:apoptosis antagonizing transcription factor-domain-containing protein [Spinellus fusiger]
MSLFSSSSLLPSLIKNIVEKSLNDLIADLGTTAPKDYDPEDIDGAVDDRNNVDSEEEDVAEDKGGREHYVKVGKSALRSQQFLMDDPRYFGKRASRKDIYSSDEEEDEEYNKDEEDEEDDKDEEDSEESEAEDGTVKDEMRKIEADEKEMLSQMSKSAQSDIEKGQHVKQQLQLWDNFLESRIRVQKVVEMANQLPQYDVWPDVLAKEENIEENLDAVKEGLREVIDTMMDLRTSLFEENTAIDMENCSWNSRKRCTDDDDEYNEKLWQDISQVNDVFVSFRDATLEKWSNKVQAASSVRLNKKFKAFDQNILTQVENVLSDKETLIKRTQLQRAAYSILGKVLVSSVEEAQTAQTEVDKHLNTYDTEIFDDNDFYQQQLRELIESRMIDTEDPIAMGIRWAANKQADIKKKNRVVDQKASKGRKLR